MIFKQMGMVAILVTLALAVMAVPVTARIGYMGVEPGDVIFIYEKNLDVTAFNSTVARFVHYADIPAGSVDDVIAVTSETDFNVPPTVKFPGEAYYASTAASLGTTEFVLIDRPEISLDIVSGVTLVEKLTNMTIIEGTLVTFRIISNVPNGFNLATSPPYVELRFTTPEGGQTRVFGGVNYGRSISPVSTST
jgi:hypothetical protein